MHPKRNVLSERTGDQSDRYRGLEVTGAQEREFKSIFIISRTLD